MLEPGKILGDRYEIIKKIGAGGMSIVYLAKCNRLQRCVAIKVLRTEFVKDEAFVNKFRAEAFAAGSLSHPNIVGIYDVGAEEDLHYIVMEYVEGHTLKEVIEKEGHLAPNVVLDYGMQIVSALRHAHKKQIIHRDIKPQNILVTADNVLKVTDFGIARAVDSSTIVATGNAIGSVHYFSPEQAKGKYVNETSDLYSCGIVMFEMATGRLPFEADSHVTVALKHINEEIPRPSQFVPAVWPGIEQIILKATDKKQELRYQNADAMLEDMKKVLANPQIIISSNEEESIDQTILLSAEQTDYIRQNEKPQPVPVPVIEVPQMNKMESQLPEDFYQEDEVEDEARIPVLYKILVSMGGVLATLVILGIIAVFAFFKLPALSAPKLALVPNMVGQTLSDAEKLAKDVKLTIKKVDEEARDDVMAGTIVSQEPPKEQLVEPGTVIEVVVAVEKEVEMGRVPDVISLDIAAATDKLDKEGFFPVTVRENSDEFENGQVMDQSPLAGERLAKGEVVTITVSKGPKVEMVRVPNLVGSTEADAKLTLRNNGLTLGSVRTKESDTVPEGQVISQSALHNTEIEKGSVIDIEVSSGPKEQEEVVPEPEEVEPAPSEPEEVIPEPEEEVEPTEVTLTRIINDPGLGKDEYHVLVMLDSASGSRIVFDDVVRKEQLPLPIQVKGSGKGTLTTYFDGKEQYKDPIVFNEVTQ